MRRRRDCFGVSDTAIVTAPMSAQKEPTSSCGYKLRWQLRGKQYRQNAYEIAAVIAANQPFMFMFEVAGRYWRAILANRLHSHCRAITRCVSMLANPLHSHCRAIAPGVAVAVLIGSILAGSTDPRSFLRAARPMATKVLLLTRMDAFMALVSPA